MNPTGPMAHLPAPPDDRELPDRARRRNQVLALIAADRPAARVPRWAVPLGAAVAVAAIAVAAAALVPLVRSGRAPAHGTHPANPATTAPPAPCRAAGGAECRQTDRYAGPAPAAGLIVRDDVGSVTVTGTSGGSVSVSEQLVYRGLPPALTRSSAGGVLSLGYRCRSGDCGVDYDITVPRSLNVQVIAGTGSVSLNALAGPLRVTIDVGPVRGRNLSSRSAQLSTGVGAIDAAFAAAPADLVAQADTGPVTLRVPAGASYAVAASAGVGAVTVTVPTQASSGHVIRASSDVGAVTVTGG
jgi:hypothetical protein